MWLQLLSVSAMPDTDRAFTSVEDLANEPRGTYESVPVFGSDTKFRMKPGVWQALPVPRYSNDVPGMWHSISKQDHFVYELLEQMKGGYFVDLASNHPVDHSNSRALERDHNWHGLCIEANPRYWRLLRAVRSCTVVGVAASDLEGVATFQDTRKGGSGALAALLNKPKTDALGTFQVRTMPLRKILAQLGSPRNISYFSLDVEKAEPLVMSSFPWEAHRFAVMTVEMLSDKSDTPEMQARNSIARHRRHRRSAPTARHRHPVKGPRPCLRPVPQAKAASTQCRAPSAFGCPRCRPALLPHDMSCHCCCSLNSFARPNAYCHGPLQQVRSRAMKQKLRKEGYHLLCTLMHDDVW
eukprot:7050366-Prymnesium_polylepis.1